MQVQRQTICVVWRSYDQGLYIQRRRYHKLATTTPTKFGPRTRFFAKPPVSISRLIQDFQSHFPTRLRRQVLRRVQYHRIKTLEVGRHPQLLLHLLRSSRRLPLGSNLPLLENSKKKKKKKKNSTFHALESDIITLVYWCWNQLYETNFERSDP